MAEARLQQPHLNTEQRAAAERLWKSSAPALQLIAGAGSGKTTTLVAAICAAVEHGFSSERIAVISFTRKSARELSERLAAPGISPGFCGTIHALAWRLLKARGNAPRLLVDSASAKSQVIRKSLPGLEHVPDRLLTRPGFLSVADSERVAAAWREHLESQQLIDFDSMVSRAAELPGIAGLFDAIFIDEFQDTSPDQVAFARALAPAKLFVVGDDWQSIYRFRGADVSVTRDFQRLVPGAERLFLVKNYRSSRQIVALGNATIRQSSVFVRKRLLPTLGPHMKPVVYLTDAAEMTQAWGSFATYLQNASGLPRPLTVLVRTNAQRRLLESSLPAGCKVMTIHKSKGLEFDHVLVFGIAEHSMPHRENDTDEEVRILYVALTRARRFLGFVAWEQNEKRSPFLSFLLKHCKLQYF
ncbi:MAG TPA: UvrD-helicase domain-containing protein [Turneriella sp.]|nr:UvrD-helicase domain-containing protein [Turneriella sp.]